MQYKILLLILLLSGLTACQSTTPTATSPSRTMALMGKTHQEYMNATPAIDIIEATRENDSAKPLIPASNPVSPAQQNLEKGMLIFSILRVISTPVMMF